MHASAFLIRETKSGRRFARFFPLRIFMGACNQGRKVLEFLLWCRHCRHSFGFSRNNMKGALYHWRNPIKSGTPKRENFNFSFLALSGVLGMKSLTCLGFSMKLRNVQARHQILMEVQATISRTDLTKLQTLGSIILLSFFEY